jgi:hypothetical protein
MDVGKMAGTAAMMKTGQAQQIMAISLLKMAAEQQNLSAAMLDQGVRNAAQIVARSEDGFSVYA